MNDSFGPLPRATLLRVVGGTLVVTLLLVAAFSVGLVVGEARAGNPPSAARMLGLPAAAPKPAPDPLPQSDGARNRPTVAGVVLSVSGDTLAIRAAEGPRLVVLDDSTVVRGAAGEPAVPGDLVRGVRVAVFAAPDESGRVARARWIVILPEAEP